MVKSIQQGVKTEEYSVGLNCQIRKLCWGSRGLKVFKQAIPMLIRFGASYY